MLINKKYPYISNTAQIKKYNKQLTNIKQTIEIPEDNHTIDKEVNKDKTLGKIEVEAEKGKYKKMRLRWRINKK